MNRRMILHLLGVIMLAEAALMLIPTAVALIYSESVFLQYIISAGICAATALALFCAKPKTKTIFARDGLVIVSLSWIVISLFGAVPFVLTGEIPSYLDAVFEMVSGFTTTGASILSDLSPLSHASLFWRSFSHWIGGMGFLVFIMAVLPLASGGGNIHLMRAESPGPDVGKLVPKSRYTARILYGIYIALTVFEIILLLCGGMPLFDSITLSMGTAGTGGFSISNAGFSIYNRYCITVITVFMVLFGINFNIYYLTLCKRVKDALRSTELRVYLGVIFASVTIITINIHKLYSSVGAALGDAAFQVSSLITTTGYTTADFNKWPELSRMLLLLLMCMGAMAGSTGGGLKVSRVVLLFQAVRRQVRKLSHPRNVTVVTFERKRVSEDVIQSTLGYFIIYVLIMIVSFLLVSLDSNTDMVTNISSVIATFNNIGPGLEKVGAIGNYGACSALSKVVFIVDMLLGRLEIFPFMCVFYRTGRSRFNRKRSI